MTKINRRFNSICARISFWTALSNHFSGFTNLLKPSEYLTSEDRQVLFEIRALLVECNRRANMQRKEHSDRLKKLTKEYRNGR